MVKYLIYPTASQAYNRSREIALSLGAGDSPDDMTKYWFGVIEHPSGEGAMEIPEDEINKLTQAEQALLKDYTFMENQGWFN